MEAGLKDLFQSDKYTDYLKTMSRFHHYSSRNIMLINTQKPGATLVASFNTWEKQFKRHVKKGEQAIWIFAPIGQKKPETKLMEKLDPETGAPLLDENGKPIMIEMTALSSGPRFKLVPVFDASQTDGDPLAKLAENLTGNVAHYEAFMDALKAVSPLPIVFEPMAEEQDGYCRYGKQIGIREGMSEIQTVAAAVHEISHAKLHDLSLATDRTPKSKAVKETEAESISFVVNQYFQIETSPNSFGYLAEYGSRDMSELKASLDTIRKEANNLINAIEERFQTICKERGIDLATKEPEKPAPQTEQPAEPQYTTATRVENIAGVDFEFHDVIPQMATQKYIQTPPEQSQAGQMAEQKTSKQAPKIVPHEIIPDPAITQTEMNLYGYSQPDMLPLLKEKALQLFDKDVPVFMLNVDNTETLVFDRDEIEKFGGIFGIDRADWQKTPAYAAQADNIKIYQLLDVDDLRYHRFASLKQLETEYLTVDRGNYELIYTAPLSPTETLDSLYERFNIYPPKDYPGRSLSVSDVVVIQRDGQATAHYVDNVGFAEIAGFLTDKRQEKTVPNPDNETPAGMVKTDQQTARHTVPDDPSLTPEPIKPADIALYRQPPAYARECGELDLYRQSRDLNFACAAAIDKAIKESHYDPYHYDLKTAAKTVLTEYGAERVDWVLANTVQKQHYDGRYSDSNKKWARSFDIPATASSFFCRTHPHVLDGFIDRAREAAIEKPSVLEALKQNTAKSNRQLDKPENKQKVKKPKGQEVI